MLPLPYTQPVAAGVFAVACLIWLLPEVISTPWQMARVFNETAVVHDRSSFVILIGLQWVGLVLNFSLAWLIPTTAIPGPRTVLFAIGIIFIVLGVALRWYAIRTLGRFFTREVAVSAGQRVIDRGPYRLIRHPAYSGTFLTMLGVGLAMTNWASLACLLICVFLGHWYRFHVEEQALVSALGQPYVEYMQRTKRFIPKLF
jgi:protein-S-isoprenylcysteine O-methyltransferase Ste14